MELSVIQLFFNASWVVKTIMLILLLASILSWYLIFYKKLHVRRAKKQATQFEERFWKGRDLKALFSHINSQDHKPNGMEVIFDAGYNEFMRLCKTAIAPMDLIAGAQRQMQIALQREIDQLELHLSTLATIGSISPYIGLFGTVWGIMHSFRSLADVQQATLQMVAPGISEALVATAMGLFAAIPAVIAYNHYATQVERLINRYDMFLDEFTSVLQRQVHKDI
jgi:biopolymer transport protein TolQ